MKDASGNLTVNSFVSWVTDSIDSIVPSRNLGSVEIERKEGTLYGSWGNVSSGRRSSQQLSILKLKDLNHNQSSITMELCLYTALQTRT